MKWIFSSLLVLVVAGGGGIVEAQQIGLTIPESVLHQADKVIKEASAKAGGR